MRSLFVLCGLAVIASADTSVRSRTQGTIRPVSYIVPAARGSEFYWVNKTKYWTPTRSQVDGLEARLPKYLRKAQEKELGYGLIADRLQSYARQYVGIYEGNEKRIWVNAYSMDGSTPSDVEKGPPVVDDGGCGFWRLIYDPALRTFSALECNGPG